MRHRYVKRRLCLMLACVGALCAIPGPGIASAQSLSKQRAVRAAYRLAQRVGRQVGAVYAVAGYCKRKSRNRVDCWAGIILPNRYGAAQRVRVTLSRGRINARKYGRVYKGYVGEKSSSQSGSEWAICGIHSSVCIGS
jgi:hypothetical protein